MSSTPNDRKAKAQAAAKVDHGGGPNRILVAGLVAVVALAAIIAGTIFATRSGSGGGGGGAQALPTGTERGEGIVVNADEVKGKDVPTVDVYEDFRCPVCKVYEVGLGKTTQELAEEGKIKLVVHLKTVIDSSLGGDASKVAASTAVCAAEQGKWFEYHDALFAKQDPQEGPFADGAFGEAAQEAGITGADRVAFDQLQPAGADHTGGRLPPPVRAVLPHQDDRRRGDDAQPLLFDRGRIVPRSSSRWACACDDRQCWQRQCIYGLSRS